MSDRDFLNLDDDALDADTVDAGGGWDADLLDDFPDDDPAAADPPARAAVSSKPQQAPSPAATPTPGKGASSRRRRPRVSGRGGGVLAGLFVLLAALTLGTGLLTATGVAPDTLLDFSGFQDPLTIGDFRSHPVNAFWVAVLVTLVAATMAAVVVDRRFKQMAIQTGDQIEKLDAVAQLDPDQPETWQHPVLQDDPDLAAVASNLLGHYNLQQAKLLRYVDLESELRRLEEGLNAEDTAQLEGRWENPAASSLADQILVLIRKQHDAAAQEEQKTAANAAQGAELMSGLREAQQWARGAADHINQQGAAAERVARQLDKLLARSSVGEERNIQLDRLRQALSAVQEALVDLPVRDADKHRDATAPLSSLVERASRLAFQIAMEVARLGARGERLLPLTQDLEDLTTELRRISDRPAQAGDDGPREKALDAVRGRLAELDPTILMGIGGPGAADMQDMAPAAEKVATSLAQLVRQLGGQSERLASALALAAAVTGQDAREESPPTAPGPQSDLDVEQYDPFGSEVTPESGLVADPFASSSRSVFSDTPAGGAADDFSQSVLPGADLPPAPPAPERSQDPMPAMQADPTPGSLFSNDQPETQPTAPDAARGVPHDDEKVYDLLEFDARRLPPEPSTETGEMVHDLDEFGAVKIS